MPLPGWTPERDLERYVLSVDPGQEHPVHWTLSSRSSDRVVAAVEAPAAGVPYVRPAGGGTYRIEAYARGWRLAARATWDERVLLWYTGRWVRSGGRLLVAPDRVYDVRSALFKRLDLHVRDGDGRRILSAHAAPRGGDAAEVAVSLHRLPDHPPDAELLVSFVAALELLVFTERPWTYARRKVRDVRGGGQGRGAPDGVADARGRARRGADRRRGWALRRSLCSRLGAHPRRRCGSERGCGSVRRRAG